MKCPMRLSLMMYASIVCGASGIAAASPNPVRLDPADPAVSVFTSISNFNAINKTLFFAANDGIHGVELWKSNGTSTGTVLVKDINPIGDSNPECLVDCNGLLYFFATTNLGKRLWSSDGTGTGTVMIDAPLGTSDIPFEMTKMGGSLYFATPGKLWKSNGMGTGTVMLKNTGISGSVKPDPKEFTVIANQLYFIKEIPYHRGELWRSDGTSAGTILVREFPDSYGTPHDLMNGAGTLFFLTDVILWKSDGTTSGTGIVSGSSNYQPPGQFFISSYNVKDSVYIASQTGSNKPWSYIDRYDSITNSWTRIFYRYADERSFNEMANINGMLIFNRGSNLYKSDGTENGTVLIKSLAANSATAFVANMSSYYGKLYFIANDEFSHFHLWVSNGTTSGTEIVVPLTNIDYTVRPMASQNSLFFVSTEPAGKALWTLDLDHSAAGAGWLKIE